MRPFDVCGPLPTGVTVLEASAGTGKTYTIAALAARYVAEGVPLRQLLLVTFTRMATGELRERVRDRLVATEAALARAVAGAPPGPADDAVVRLLAAGDPATVERRRWFLARAIADFDAATIDTTHGFCHEVLGGLGLAGDVERGVELVEDVADLVDTVVDDLYVRRFHTTATPELGRAEAGAVARAAIDNPTAPLEPSDGQGVPGMRMRLAEAARGELDRRKRLMGQITFDDLLTRLEAALAGPDGAVVAARLAARWQVVLIDEFQDTDPVQWSIVRRAFGGGRLVLIGDPKQAIYAFRGADVYAYLAAARAAADQATLAVNRRSDQGLLDAFAALFGGARLGHPGIVAGHVLATPAHQAPRLRGAPVGTPLRLRIVHRDEPALELTGGGYVRAPSARDYVARDLAHDVVGLLAAKAVLEDRADDGSVRGTAPLRPGDIAVLVSTNRDAALVRDALERVGVPAVINGAGSVFGTAPALEWLRLLEALERPAAGTRARVAAISPFLGWTAARVDAAGEGDWDDVHRRLHEWSRVLREHGVAALLETVVAAEDLPGRILRTEDGERAFTDVRHIGQLLHAEATEHQLGTSALVAWLRRRIAEATEDRNDEDRSRRLESDAEAVQVLTVYRAKGLEFPVVYAPFLFFPSWFDEKGPVAFHDEAERRVVDVGLEGAAFEAHVARHREERRGEDLRLAYVALTRARHQAVVWWAPVWEAGDGPLTRLLFSRAEDGTIAPSGPRPKADAKVRERFDGLAAAANGQIALERAVVGPPRWWSDDLRAPATLAAATFDRALDGGWRRTSFSDITADAHGPRVGSEPEAPQVDDEPEAPPPVAADDGAGDPRRAIALPLADQPGGTGFGTLVHEVLEAADFAAPDLTAELAGRIAAARAYRPVELGDPDALAAGLATALATPLGAGLGGAPLAGLARGDRLDELAFELPLAGGDAPSGHLRPQAIASLLRTHLGAEDPLAGYAERLGDPALRTAVRGYLTGTIDLVARIGGRYVVVDYKSNRLAPREEAPTAWHYRPEALRGEMERAHYGLQALLYVVALHRYLRWRIPAYDPATHLGGVGYLFLRGMRGPDAPGEGVFAWQPPPALVTALSDLLDEGTG